MDSFSFVDVSSPRFVVFFLFDLLSFVFISNCGLDPMGLPMAGYSGIDQRKRVVVVVVVVVL